MLIIVKRLYPFLRWCPGALGLLLRQKFYPVLLGSCGKNILIGRFVDLVNPHNIMLGDSVILSNRAVLDGGGKSEKLGLIIEDNVFIGIGSSLRVTSHSIKIGKGSNIGSTCSINSYAPLYVGEKVLFAAFCVVGNKRAVPELDLEVQQTTIGDGCWIGVRAVILDGVTIGNGAIVGAHAVVSSDIAENVIATGNPATAFKKRVTVIK